MDLPPFLLNLLLLLLQLRAGERSLTLKMLPFKAMVKAKNIIPLPLLTKLDKPTPAVPELDGVGPVVAPPLIHLDRLHNSKVAEVVDNVFDHHIPWDSSEEHRLARPQLDHQKGLKSNF